jgi:hypothetical protein
MKKIYGYFGPVTAFILMVLAFTASPARAVLTEMADDKTLKIHVGDKLPMDLEVVRKAHDEGKVIVLMFGNVDHCLYCEKNWERIKEAVGPFRPGVKAILRNYRSAKFDIPLEEDVKYAAKFGLIGEPWTFIVNRKGEVTQIFMGIIETAKIAKWVKKAVDYKEFDVNSVK